jgi:hypothetical protein
MMLPVVVMANPSLMRLARRLFYCDFEGLFDWYDWGIICGGVEIFFLFSRLGSDCESSVVDYLVIPKYTHL